jgi:hypothetical protein
MRGQNWGARMEAWHDPAPGRTGFRAPISPITTCRNGALTRRGDGARWARKSWHSSGSWVRQGGMLWVMDHGSGIEAGLANTQ